MELTELLQEARQSIIETDGDRARAIAQQAIDEGHDPVVVLSDGFSAGIQELGELFGRGEIFLPELIMAAEAMKEASALLDTVLKKDVAQNRGKMLITTVEGDVHDIGKGIVVSMVQAQGVEVFDLGRDTSVEEIIRQAEENQVDIIGTSALLTTTMTEQKKLADTLAERGLRGKYKLIVGGSPCTQRWADKIGADAYAEDAAEAVAKVLALLEAR